MLSRTHRRASLVTAVLLVLTACGSDEKAADTVAPTATDAPLPATDAGTPTTAAAGIASAVPAEVGPADNSLDPVAVGFINNTDSQPFGFPGNLAAIQASVAVINDRLGGIDGHPVVLKDCSANFDASSVQECAQQFANDGDVNVVVSGVLVAGSDTLYETLTPSRKPVLVSLPLSPADITSPNAVSYFDGSPGEGAGTALFVARKLGAKKISIISSDTEFGRNAVSFAEPLLAAEGAHVTTVYVADTEADYTGPITAAGADTADALLLIMAPPACIAVARALDSLNIDVPVASTSACADTEVVSQVADLVEDWYIGYGGIPQSAPTDDPEGAYFRQMLDEYATSEAAINEPAAFAAALTLWQIGNGIGYDKLSVDTWKDGMLAFQGPVFLHARRVSCPGAAAFPSLCVNEIRVFQLKNGVPSVDANDGEPFVWS